MGRKSTVAEHPQRTRIDNMLDDGVSYAEISRTIGNLSLPAIGRYSLSRKSELAKIADDEPGVTQLLARLVQVAEHARDLRHQAKLTGSPLHQARAIKSETDVLGKLMDELGVKDTTVAETLEESRVLVTAFKIFVRTYPESARDLVKVLADIPETAELAEALARAGKKTA